MIVPKDLKYTESHEWIKLEEGVARIGITDYAQEELGEVVYIELPDIGTYLEQSSSLGIVESIKSVSEIYAPLSGKVLEVNKDLTRQPQLVNQDPYGRGWLISIQVNLEESASELDLLLEGEEYEDRFSDRGEIAGA